MANKDLMLSFRMKDGLFKLCATERKTGKRAYKSVSSHLDNPNLESWNNKAQSFDGLTDEAIRNNRVLQEILKRYQAIIDTQHPLTGKELFALADGKERANDAPAKTEPTFGEYIQRLITEMKNGSNKKLPSKNYQTYITLLHKLEREGNVINIPLSEINNQHFIDFGKWVLSLPDDEGGSNYRNLMKRFKAAHNKAFRLELNNHILRYDFMADAPKRAAKERMTLTETEYKQFVSLDLSQIKRDKREKIDYELLRDFCRLIYALKVRPVDAIRLLHRNISTDGYMQYIPEKKKNYQTDEEVTNWINDEAREIIDKYSGQSSKGYVLPFPMNEIDWDFNNADSWNKWQRQVQNITEHSNLFLKKVAPLLGVDPKQFINYTFRHSAFQHEIEKGEKDRLTIAQEGGTSLEMLQKHYGKLISRIEARRREQRPQQLTVYKQSC
ncbi:MAG: hypothetical protein LBL78_01965 [Prevotellaceae bacterium]|jgi:hypothetical protein|nr:hypothetical protein [Prevotellaceae bacterium]